MKRSLELRQCLRPRTSCLPVNRPESARNAHNPAASAKRSVSVSANLSSRDRRGRSWKQPRTGWAQLSKVGLHHIDNLIGRERLLRIRCSPRVKHMVPDMAFQELSHQAVDCTSCRTDDL